MSKKLPELKPTVHLPWPEFRDHFLEWCKHRRMGYVESFMDDELPLDSDLSLVDNSHLR